MEMGGRSLIAIRSFSTTTFELQNKDMSRVCRHCMAGMRDLFNETSKTEFW